MTTEAEAMDLLATMSDAFSAPTLSLEELASILGRAGRADADGNGTGDAGWSPTWDLSWAASEAWRLKASRCVGRFDFSADGDRYQASQVFAHCQAMADQYAKQTSMVSVKVPSTLDRTVVVTEGGTWPASS